MGRGRKKAPLVVQQEVWRIDERERALREGVPRELNGRGEGGHRVAALLGMYGGTGGGGGGAASTGRAMPTPPAFHPTPPRPPTRRNSGTPAVGSTPIAAPRPAAGATLRGTSPLLSASEPPSPSISAAGAPSALHSSALLERANSHLSASQRPHRSSLVGSDFGGGGGGRSRQSSTVSHNPPPQPSQHPGGQAGGGGGGGGAVLGPSNDYKDRAFRKTGKCSDMHICECIFLMAVVILGVAVAACGIVAFSEDDDPPPDPLPTTHPILIGKVVSYVQSYTTSRAHPASFPLSLLRDEGVKITLLKKGGALFSPFIPVPGATETPIPIFRDLVAFHSNLSSGLQPEGFGAHIPQISNGFGEFLSFTPTQIIVGIRPGLPLKGSFTEGVKMWLNGDGSEGLPVEFSLQGDPLLLPSDAQAEIEGHGSKAAAAAGIASSLASVGTAASVAALPRLNFLASAFSCPSPDYFEVNWLSHPLVLLDFPDIDIGDYPPLARHIAAFTAAYVILCGASFLLCTAGAAVYLFSKGSSWRGSFSKVGFPSYLLEFYMFLTPGVAVTTMQVAFYHPSVGAQLYAVGSFLVLVVLPWAVQGFLFTKACFKGELVDAGDSRPLAKFFSGSKEWDSKDDSFLGMFSLFFEDYLMLAKWFILFEVFVSVALGVIEAGKPGGRSGCMWRSWAMLVVCTAHFCTLVFLRPLLAALELGYTLFLSLLNTVLIFFIVVNQHEGNRDSWSADAAAGVALVATWAVRVKCVIDLIVFAYSCTYRPIVPQDSRDIGYIPMPPFEATPPLPPPEKPKPGLKHLTITVGETEFTTDTLTASEPSEARSLMPLLASFGGGSVTSGVGCGSQTSRSGPPADLQSLRSGVSIGGGSGVHDLGSFRSDLGMYPPRRVPQGSRASSDVGSSRNSRTGITVWVG